MSSFCWIEICARWASNAVGQQRVEVVDRLRDPGEVVGDVAEVRRRPRGGCRRRAPAANRLIGSRSGSTARRTSASSRLRT